MPSLNTVQIIVPQGQSWPNFSQFRNELPDFCAFAVGDGTKGVPGDSRGYGARVLTVKTAGQHVQVGVDAAMRIAERLGLDATVVQSDEHFRQLVGWHDQASPFGRVR